MAKLKAAFEAAVAASKQLPDKPDNATLLKLYSLYKQATEERDHAMMMIQYLLDSDAEIRIPALEAPEMSFADVIAPVKLALDQEKRVTDQINELTRIARDENDFASDQFMQWFVKEQVEEVAKMSDLLAVVTRSASDYERIEDWVAREDSGVSDDPTAPRKAGA